MGVFFDFTFKMNITEKKKGQAVQEVHSFSSLEKTKSFVYSEKCMSCPSTLSRTYTPKHILDKYATTIIRKSKNNIFFDHRKQKWGVKARWKSEPERYQYNPSKYSEDLCLWIPPPNWLVLEFESTPEENRRWIELTAYNIDVLGMDACICSHQGKSPYIWICNITGMETHYQKKQLAAMLVPQGSKLDYTNLGRTLVPVIGNLHWKYGTVHEIIVGINPCDQKNKLPPLPEPKKNFSFCDVPKKELFKPQGSNKDLISRILNTDFKVQKLLGGNLSGYNSPSEGRLALLNCLVAYGLNDSDIIFIMNQSHGLNWLEKPHLHKRELKLSRSYCKTKRRILEK